jgi:hypothetical protein
MEDLIRVTGSLENRTAEELLRLLMVLRNMASGRVENLASGSTVTEGKSFSAIKYSISLHHY